MSNSFEIIQQQRKEMNLLQKEIEAEERYLHILSMTYRETCRSKIGKENSRSIAQQLNIWIKNLSESQKKNMLLLVELDNTLSKFREYILNKYEGNAKRKNKFEELFSNINYCKDVKRIMIHKIYDYKLEQSLNNFENGFVSPKAHSICALNQQMKEVRNAAHEGMATAYRNLTGPTLPDDIEKTIEQIFERVVKKKLKTYGIKTLKGSDKNYLN